MFTLERFFSLLYWFSCWSAWCSKIAELGLSSNHESKFRSGHGFSLSSCRVLSYTYIQITDFYEYSPAKVFDSLQVRSIYFCGFVLFRSLYKTTKQIQVCQIVHGFIIDYIVYFSKGKQHQTEMISCILPRGYVLFLWCNVDLDISNAGDVIQTFFLKT